jgi:hypothetical protein
MELRAAAQGLPIAGCRKAGGKTAAAVATDQQLSLRLEGRAKYVKARAGVRGPPTLYFSPLDRVKSAAAQIPTRCLRRPRSRATKIAAA